MMKILQKAEVAAILGLTEKTLSSQMARNPDSLPPWFKRPHGKRPLWFEQTVIAFLENCARDAGALPQTQKKKA
jgi:hypothetical protein